MLRSSQRKKPSAYLLSLLWAKSQKLVSSAACLAAAWSTTLHST